LHGQDPNALSYADQKKKLKGVKEVLIWETFNKRIKFKALPDGLIGTLNLHFLQQADFSNYFDRIVADISEDLAETMKLMSSLRSNIDDYALKSDDAAKRSFHSKEALRDYSLLKGALGQIGGETGLFKKEAVKENKEKERNILDILIEQVILNR